jgi:UDP-N-acetylglucosamine transferase subunit ALG13
MTNLICKLILVLSTNWTGGVLNNKEVGVVVTNHVVEITYEGKTNDIVWCVSPSDRFVLRPLQVQTTNIGTLIITNTQPYWWGNITPNIILN